MMKLSALKSWLDQQLSAVTQSTAQTVTERNLLLKHQLGISIEMLFSDPDKEIVLDGQYEALLNIVEQRTKERIPIQYLLKEAAFFGLTFQVTPNVLIPRPETELLVEKALQLCQTHQYRSVLDLGTGSGCIAISLKHALPSLAVTAIDVSSEALAVAIANALKHQTEIQWHHGSWLEPVHGERFDLIVSNPPYIDAADRSNLTPEVLHEPETALFSPDRPKLLYHTLITTAKAHLKPKGAFLFEMGLGQSEELVQFAGAAGFSASSLKDYAGIPRILLGSL